MELPEVHPWCPDDPVLYDVTVTATRDDEACDRVVSYVGFREVATDGGTITLNGEPVFLRGVLDQGYWPNGAYTPPTASALEADVRAVKVLGFNLARKHVKVEDARWYYWCDRLGLLVMQDMPSSADLSTPPARSVFRRELQQMVGQLSNHACVIVWALFNEDWGAPGPTFQSEMVALVRQLDPHRLIVDASGWHQGESTDLRDGHEYGSDVGRHVPRTPAAPPTLVGEYGGVSFPVEGSAWQRDEPSWGYQEVTQPSLLLDLYGQLTDQLQHPGLLAGFVYTQLTDVESETNGLLTHDRRPKATSCGSPTERHQA